MITELYPTPTRPETLSDDWMTRAACADEDPSLFFPGDGDAARLIAEQAKAVCYRCPVVADCLAAALENDEQDGIWGGHTKEERQALQQRKAKQRKMPRPATGECSKCGAQFVAEKRGQRRCPTHARQKVAQCGSASGYQRHLKSDEQPCQPCITAHREARKAWAAKAGAR